MSDIAIRVAGLGKRYRIGDLKKYKALRDVLTNVLYAPMRAVSTLKDGQFFNSNLNSEKNTIWALKDVSFEVTRGEVVGVIGRNGAGKSTLLKILSRITEPTEGYAKIRGRVGSLLEVGTGFHPELTGRENVYLNGAIIGMHKVEIQQRFDEIVSFAEMEKFIDTPVKYYSSGMYVRLAFSVAAHLETEILFIDEVLAVGDVTFQKKCLGKMGDVANQGRTIIFVSHNMAAIQELCSSCVLLSKGGILYQGSPVDVVSHYLNRDVNTASVDFSSNVDRIGNGDTRIKSIKILDESGRGTPVIFMGKGFSVIIQFEIGKKVLAKPSFGILIRNSIGQPITRVITKETIEKAPGVASGGSVKLNIEQNNLMPGLYYLSAGISNMDEQLDFIEDAIALEIAPAPVFPGGKLPKTNRNFLIYLPCTWEWEYEVL